jgi:hypothetical protein
LGNTREQKKISHRFAVSKIKKKTLSRTLEGGVPGAGLEVEEEERGAGVGYVL